jgi:hypothetical protein
VTGGRETTWSLGVGTGAGVGVALRAVRDGAGVGEPLSSSTVAGTFGGSGLSVRAKLVAAIPRGITTTAARAAILRVKTMEPILPPHGAPRMSRR